MNALGVGDLETKVQHVDQKLQAVADEVRTLVANCRGREETQSMGGTGRGPAPAAPRPHSVPQPVTPQKPQGFQSEPNWAIDTASFGTSGGFGGQSRIPTHQATSDVNQSPLGEGFESPNGLNYNLDGPYVMKVAVLEEKTSGNGMEGITSLSQSKS